MLRSMFWWPKPPLLVKYGTALLAVFIVIVLSQWLETVIHSTPQVSLLLCAIMLSAWLGGLGPGLFAIGLSVLAFEFFFLLPNDSFAMQLSESPRLVVFILSALLVGLLSALQRSTSESLRLARDDLYATVQELQRANSALQAENQERRRAEDELTQAAQMLEQRVGERTHELSTLLGISNTIASTLELQPLLHLVLDRLQLVVPYTCATIFALEEDELVVIGHAGPRSSDRFAHLRLPASQASAFQGVCSDCPIIIDDLQSDTLEAQEFRDATQTIPVPALSYARSLLLVPLIVRERPIAFLWIAHEDPRVYSAHNAQLALVFANQAAAAIENARLYNQARDLATLEERQRLARELHDAVTQTLFSASLIAEALPEAWKHSPAKAERGLEELRLLTRGALAEMRTLLLELRPAALTEKPLPDILQALSASVTSRTRIPIELKLEGNTLLAPQVQIALYRITQEVLNNIAKHAAASHVSISGRYAAERVEMQISDNGRGFDRTSLAPNSFGLEIMRERAASIGAQLHIESESGLGTKIQILWQGASNPPL